MITHTPREWRYGIRKDGTMWLSIGDPKSGQHSQGELVATKADADLIVAAPALLASLIEVMGWISNWNPNFVQDENWPATARAAHATISRATGGHS